MATIQHKDIPNAQLHEPKGVATAATKQVYIANGAGSGLWRKLNDLDFDYTTKTNNLFGWNDIADTQYHSGATRSITANVRTLLTNNGLAAQSDTSRLGSLWDATNSKFIINDLNAAYVVRVNCKITAAAAAGVPYLATFELESSNGPTVILGQTVFIKGGGVVNPISVPMFFYSGYFINNTDLKLYLTTDTATALYDIGFVIQRTYKES